MNARSRMIGIGVVNEQRTKRIKRAIQMPPRDGFTVTHFITVADIDRSADFYEKVFGGRILSRGDNKGASGHIQIANTWLIVNVGGGPTPDKPSVTLRFPADPDKVSNCTWRIVKMGRKSKHFALLIRWPGCGILSSFSCISSLLLLASRGRAASVRL